MMLMKELSKRYGLNGSKSKLNIKLGRRLRGGAAGVAYRNPTHLLDAPSISMKLWQSMSPSSIKNVFVKAKIMTLEVGKH